MNTIVFLYGADSESHAFDRLFDGKCAFERVLDWCKKLDLSVSIAVTEQTRDEILKIAAEKEVSFTDVISIDPVVNNTRTLIEKMAFCCSKNKAESIIMTSIDKPFLDIDLTKDVMECHEKYVAEYTFADGYPYGFAPVMVNSGTLNILLSLIDSSKSLSGTEKVSDECIFNVMKGDINSFEIEAVISPKDYRMSRFDFSCNKKRNAVACKKLFDAAVEHNAAFEAIQLSDIAENSAAVQHTLPAFYNVQICSSYDAKASYIPYKDEKNETMSLEKFKGLMKQISDFSEDAVVSLSAWGEPLKNHEFIEYVKCAAEYKKIKLLIETSGNSVTKEIAAAVADVTDNIIWIVELDAMTEKMYQSVWSDGSFSKAAAAINILGEYFPEVYPQFVRMTDNESELEAFYRFWSDKNSPSKGKLIIQKYDSFCGLLENKKPADLSPVERNVCWHLKRDMTILCDGAVPLCREMITENILGNAFDDGIEKIWTLSKDDVKKHIEKNYSRKCRDCDEYYTFNF